MLDNNLSGTDITSPKWLLSFKATIRPFLTYLFSGLYAFAFIADIKGDRLDSITKITIVIIFFWFGDRMLKNVGADKLLQMLFKRKYNEKS